MSKVYFLDIKEENYEKMETNFLWNMNKLFKTPEFTGIAKPQKVVAIKVHTGDLYNQRFLRPIYVSSIVEALKKRGADPFVTDSSGLGLRASKSRITKWTRRNAFEGAETARRHGYTQEVLGAPFLFADGMYGLDGVELEVRGHERRKVFVCKILQDVDAVICASHFKLHWEGFGGAIKNLGVGLVASPSKYYVHHYEKPRVNPEKCNACAACVSYCPVAAITVTQEQAFIDHQKCVGCDGCVEVCKPKAIEEEWTEHRDTAARMADNALGVVSLVGKENMLYFNFVLDVTQICDCAPTVGPPIVPDIGLLMSSDPVAVDKAAVDLVNESPGIPGSAAERHGAMRPGSDKFALIPPSTTWKHQIEAAERVGLGSSSYELVKVPLG